MTSASLHFFVSGFPCQGLIGQFVLLRNDISTKIGLYTVKCRTINDVLICKFEESGFYYYYYSAKKPAPPVSLVQCGKGNRGGWCRTSGRPPQHRAIVRKGHESSGVSCWFARKCSSSISIAASDLANAFSLSRSVLFATKARSLSLSLSFSCDPPPQWWRRIIQPILVANIYPGAKIRVRIKKQSASTGGWESKKREKKRETYRATIVRRSINVCYYASWLFGKLRNRSYPMASYGSLSRDDE